MKKILNISAVAVLAALPTLAFADPVYQGGSTQVLTGDDAVTPFALSADAANDGTNVVTASYVKGAYNDAIRKINTVAANAASNATTQITDAAGNGLAGSNGVLSVELTDKGGLELTGSGADGTKTLGAKVDGSTIVKDSSSGALKVGAIAESQVTDLQTHLAAKQVQLVNDASTPADVGETVYTELKALDAATGAPDDTHLATSKAIRTAINNVASDAMTLTNKSIDGDDNTIRDLGFNALKSDAVVTSTTGIGATGSDTVLPTEKAVRDAITAATSTAGMVTTTTLNNKSLNINAATAKVNDVDVVTTTGTQTLTNKSIDGDDNTIRDLGFNALKSDAVVTSTTGIGATGSDTVLPTEKAVREAITAATSTAGMVTTTTLNNKSLAVNASSLKVNDKDAATQTAVVNTINHSTVTIPVLATWGGSTPTDGSTLTVASGTYAEPAAPVIEP